MDIPKSEYFSRIRCTKQVMSSSGIDALLVYSFRFNSVRYLCGFYPDYSVSNAGLLILPRDAEPTLLVRVPAHIDTARRLAVIDDVRVCKGSSMGAGDLDAMVEDCTKILSELGLSRSTIGLAGYAPERGIEWPLRQALGGATFVEANWIIDDQRRVKSEAELQLCAKSAEIANTAYDASLDAVCEGLWEPKLVSIAENAMREGGAEAAHVHFGVLKGSKRYHVPFEREMSRGDVYILEIIPRYKGYVTETVGTFAVGEASNELQELYDDARQAYEGVAELVEPNRTTIGTLVNSVTQSLRKMRYKESGWFRLGHGMGLDNLEKPDSLIEGNQEIIKPGNMLAIHPYFEVTGWTQMIWGGTYIMERDRAVPYAKAEPRFKV